MEGKPSAERKRHVLGKNEYGGKSALDQKGVEKEECPQTEIRTREAFVVTECSGIGRVAVGLPRNDFFPTEKEKEE